ncbi:hypothetical protein Taro_002908 [Colocasia esculenta]|uniref:Uncharacterized protein n=1 Tax=Colocasia esculenta TaxID=4460 RepID=A0A843TQ86_COLES|nr:hypothetical protein [Colocasia esculenta]
MSLGSGLPVRLVVKVFRAEDALSGAGEVAVAPSMGFSGYPGFWQLVRRGNHVRMASVAWACCRRGGFGVLRRLLPSCSWTMQSVATRLRGGSCAVLSGLDTGLISQ